MGAEEVTPLGRKWFLAGTSWRHLLSLTCSFPCTLCLLHAVRRAALYIYISPMIPYLSAGSRTVDYWLNPMKPRVKANITPLSHWIWVFLPWWRKVDKSADLNIKFICVLNNLHSEPKALFNVLNITSSLKLCQCMCSPPEPSGRPRNLTLNYAKTTL